MRNPTDSQTQFLQLVCVVLVMATLIGLVAAYIMYRDVAEPAKRSRPIQSPNRQVQRRDPPAPRGSGHAEKNLPAINSPKWAMWIPSRTTRSSAKPAATSAAWSGDLSQPTLRNALVELHTRLQVVTQERNTLKKELEKTAATAQSGSRTGK